MDRTALSEALLGLYNEESGSSLQTLGEDLNFATDLRLDSVDTVSLIMQVERHFRIRFSHSELNSITAVGQMLDLITIKLQEQSRLRAA